jgi:hypothetical protein
MSLTGAEVLDGEKFLSKSHEAGAKKTFFSPLIDDIALSNFSLGPFKFISQQKIHTRSKRREKLKHRNYGFLFI